MLKDLHIHNFVLIRDLSCTLSDHYNVFTGETGAGKSLLIRALDVLCGGRASSDVVGPAGEFALVEANISLLPDDPMHEDLKLLDADDEELLISRKITKDGRSVCRINMKSINVSVLKQLMTRHIDIHQQHDAQQLMQERYHLQLLDQAMQQPKRLADYQQAYQHWQTLNAQKQDLLEQVYDPQQIDLWIFQRDELRAFSPSEDEYVSLNEEARTLATNEKTLKALSRGLQKLSGSQSPVASLREGLDELHVLNEQMPYAPIIERLKTIYYDLDDVLEQLVDLARHPDFDAERLEFVQARLFAYEKLRRKYGRDLHDLSTMADELDAKIDMSQDRELVIDQLDAKISLAYLEVEKQAIALRNERIKAARALEIKIQDQLSDLALPDTLFIVEINDHKPTVDGMDQVRFLIRTNRGMEPRPLQQIASGGELSRIMLGLKVVFARFQSTSVLLFDEIDTGVSGSIALSIGRKMHQLGMVHQVISVTHLAPVAACADAHFLIEKSSDEQQSMTDIRELDETGRVHELAMLANGNARPASLDAAKSLLDEARS